MNIHTEINQVQASGSGTCGGTKRQDQPGSWCCVEGVPSGVWPRTLPLLQVPWPSGQAKSILPCGHSQPVDAAAVCSGFGVGVVSSELGVLMPSGSQPKMDPREIREESELLSKVQPAVLHSLS